MGLRGNLRDFGAIEVLQLLTSQEKTGVLRFFQGGKRLSFVFSGGRIVSTWDRQATLADPLKSYILRKRSLPEHQMMRALRLEARTDLPFSEIILREGMMDLPELGRLVKEQILEEIRTILLWEQGQFEFSPEPSVREYGPGCGVSAETVLLEAVHQYDEGIAAPDIPPAPEDRAERPPSPPSALRVNGTLTLLLLLLPVAAFLLSETLFPSTPEQETLPLWGERMADRMTEREIRNLRLVLEMYKALNDRYPQSLVELVEVGLLGKAQLGALQKQQIHYRSLRGGERYFLHSGKHGPLVQGLPVEHSLPPGASPPPVRLGDAAPTE